MKRSPIAILLVSLFGGGWLFTSGTGQAILQQFLAHATTTLGQQQQSGVGPNQPAPGYYSGGQLPGSPYPGGQPTLTPATPPSIPAISANYRPQPATAPPTPLFGGPAIRIASFNIQVFGDAKAKRPEVMWTLAKIIQNFHVVAIQEIRTQDDYFIDNFLREYVNRDGRTYNKVVGPRLGRTRSTEQYAFLYDMAAIELNPSSVYTVNDPDDLLHREPLVAMFRVRGPPQDAFTFVLVNIHTDPDETDRELDALAKVFHVVRQYAGGEDDVIVLGDLNVDDQHLGQLGQIPGVRPIVRGVPTNTRQTAQYDNIMLHASSTAEFSGRWGVYNFEQLHNLKPEWALDVSDHCPVWAEFSAYEAREPGRMAGRPVEGISPFQGL